MKLVTVAQMRDIEKEADANGLPYAEMMENAGRGLAEIVNEVAFDDEWEEVLGLVGPGNNGGDTLVALTHLVEEGWHARAYAVKRKKKDELVTRFLDAGGEVTFAETDKDFSALGMCFESADILLDGLLGTGIKLPLKAEISAVLEQSLFIMSDMENTPYIIAVDCPSGIDCDTGEAALREACLPADLTVTMAAVKRGLLKLPAFEFVGDLAVVDIGLPDDLTSFYDLKTEVADHELVSGLLPERDLDSHKGTFGTALIAAGSINYTGAALLAGMAAYRSGVGLVTMAVPGSLHVVLAGQLPEATWILLPHDMGNIAGNAAEALTKSLESASALLVGPGLGLEAKTKEFLEGLLTGKSNAKKQTSQIGFVHKETKEDAPVTLPPMVVDADGLKLLAKISDWHMKLPPLSVLTPHPGEMSVLTGLPKDEIQKDREAVASKYAKEWGHVVVLKGAFTVIAAPNGQLTLIPVASPALARAGTGDVLAGLIVGLRAQGLDAYDAAVAGAYIHAEAGLLAAEDLGTTASVMASDILNTIVDVISDLE